MQLLQDLPRCGHNAFDCFHEVLSRRSDWLANKLQEKYKEKFEQESHGLYLVIFSCAEWMDG